MPEVRFALEAARPDAAALKAAGRGGMEWGGVARLYPGRWDTTTGGHGEAEEGVPRPPTQPRAEARADARPGSEEQRCAHVDAEHPDKAAYARCTWLWLDLARISLEQGRPHHAIAHARRIVGPGAVSPFPTDAGAARVSGRLVALRPGDSAADAVARRQGAPLAPQACMLSRAYGALPPARGRGREGHVRPGDDGSATLLLRRRAGPRRRGEPRRAPRGGGGVIAPDSAAPRSGTRLARARRRMAARRCGGGACCSPREAWAGGAARRARGAGSSWLLRWRGTRTACTAWRG